MTLGFSRSMLVTNSFTGHFTVSPKLFASEKAAPKAGRREIGADRYEEERNTP